MDITSIDVVSSAEQGIDVNIVNPRTQDPTDLTIKVKGVYSSQFRELLGKAVQREEIRKRNKVAAAVGAGGDDMAILLASVTLGWTNLEERGKQVPFSKAEAERIYTEYPIIRSQVWEAVNDVGNFIKD